MAAELGSHSQIVQTYLELLSQALPQPRDREKVAKLGDFSTTHQPELTAVERKAVSLFPDFKDMHGDERDTLLLIAARHLDQE